MTDDPHFIREHSLLRAQVVSEGKAQELIMTNASQLTEPVGTALDHAQFARSVQSKGKSALAFEEHQKVSGLFSPSAVYHCAVCSLLGICSVLETAWWRLTWASRKLW